MMVTNSVMPIMLNTINAVNLRLSSNVSTYLMTDTILGRGSRYKKGNEIAAFNYCVVWLKANLAGKNVLVHSLPALKSIT